MRIGRFVDLNWQRLCPLQWRAPGATTASGHRIAAIYGRRAARADSVKEEVQDHQYDDRHAQQPTDEILAHDDVSLNAAAPGGRQIRLAP
jgi:hypothetical protein